MAVPNESESKAPKAEEATTTSQRKSKGAADEGLSSTKGQQKTKTADDRSTTTPKDLKESPTKSTDATSTGDKSPDESEPLPLSDMVAFIRTYNDTMRRKGDMLSEDRKPKRSVCSLPLCLGIGGAVLVVTILFLILYTGLQTTCYSHETAACTTGNAACTKHWWTPTCTCHTSGQKFHNSLCQYPCDYNSKDFCPGGVCYKSSCFQDVFAFVSFIYDRKCKETAADPDCALSCAEILKYVCADRASSPLFCSDSKPTVLKDFSCQSVNVSDGFIKLKPDEEKECMKDKHCKRLIFLYPCFGGYVSKGRVSCSKECVVPKGRQGQTLFFNGYCFLKKDSCGDAMLKLTDALSGSGIGYSYDTDGLSKYVAMIKNTLKNFPQLTRLLYPLMLAYGKLAEENKVNIKFETPQTVSQFNKTLQDPIVKERLTSLYSRNADIMKFLADIVAKKIGGNVGDDRFLRVAYFVIQDKCTSFEECPGINNDIAQRTPEWAARGSFYCTLSRALFVMNLTVKETWCESMARLQGSPDLSTTSVSVMYSPSFVSDLISQASYVIEAKRLADDVFKRSRAFCDLKENVTHVNSRNVIVPMALSGALGWLNDGSPKPKRLSGFALILASAASVRKAICNEEDYIPSIDCELRLYLAFLAFLPEPSKEEKAIIANGDKASLYFTLRAAVRRQLSTGSNTPYFNNTKGSSDNSQKISKAAQALVAQCLEKIPS